MLVIDRNLYFRSDVKELIDHLNEYLVTEVEINRMSYLSKGKALVNLAFKVTNYYNDTVHFFWVPELHPHNAQVLEENIKEWLNKEELEEA